MVTFNDCVLECCKTPALVKEFDRLLGTNLSRVLIADKRPPIVRMIDESSGYQKVLDQKASEEMQKFITFIFEVIWLPLLGESVSF